MKKKLLELLSKKPEKKEQSMILLLKNFLETENDTIQC